MTQLQLPTMTFEEYIVEVHRTKNKIPHWRMGQCYFNVLHDVNLSLAESIRTTTFDPFYSDDAIEDFLCVVSCAWNGELEIGEDNRSTAQTYGFDDGWGVHY